MAGWKFWRREPEDECLECLQVFPQSVLNSFGLCQDCLKKLQGLFGQHGQTLQESMNLVDTSKYLKTKVFYCETIIQVCEELLDYEAKGIQTTEPSPVELIKTYRQKLDRFLQNSSTTEQSETLPFSNTPPDPTINIGRGITNASPVQRQKVREIILDTEDPWQVEQRLIDDFGDLNRDWRKIAVTERAILLSERHLAQFHDPSSFESKRRDKDKNVKWLPHPGSCIYCRALNGRVFTVVEPSKTHKDPEKEVWVGKIGENFGRRLNPYKRLPSGRLRLRTSDEKKAPVMPLHEHCRCCWVTI